MEKIHSHLLVLLLVAACAEIVESGIGGRSSQSASHTYYMHPYRPYRGNMIYGGLHPYPPQLPTKTPEIKRAVSGLTAWGIVGIILAVIFCGTGVYYCAKFYPIFCKKERNDNFEL